MPVGANLEYGQVTRLKSYFWRIMLGHRQDAPRMSTKKLCRKNGVPANNTAADNPNAIYDICIDMTNRDVYICTAWTSDASATTWVKIT